MKKSFFLSVFITIVFISCNSSSNQQPEVVEIPSQQNSEKKEILADNKESVKMTVEGMTCAMGCAKFIENKVSGMQGIAFSSVNFEEGTAMFEFDKTTTSAKEIESFINEMHDGQYKAKIAANDAAVEEGQSTYTKKTITSVKESFTISFPDLFTHFIKRLR